MVKLLFPGRHAVNTKFQEEYLTEILARPIKHLDFLPGSDLSRFSEADTLDQIIFPITSCNQQYSRYNPVPFHVRAISVDRFARQFKDIFGINYRIFGIPHYSNNPHFGEFILKEVHEQTKGELDLQPDSTIVMSSTPAIVEMYQKLGFAVLPAELESLDPELYRAVRPVDLIRMFAETGNNWQSDPEVRKHFSQATFSTWSDFPEVPDHVLWLFNNPLLKEHGGLTETRDYGTYISAMSRSEMIDIKYTDIKDVIVEGRIVDEGCADGALLIPIARDFPDSDLIGVEITREFMARCEENLRAGAYDETYIHFHQGNLMEDIFEKESIDTTICNSTTHEIWSYGKQRESLMDYLRKKYKQTRRNGRLVIRDVVGPENKEQEVYMLCPKDDGSNEDTFRQCRDSKELSNHLKGLSTYSRFKRFAQDFLSEMRKSGQRGEETKVQYQEERIADEDYIVLSLKDAVEFMTKKDYTENWQSELNEEFAFWSFSEWKQAITEVGFTVLETPNNPDKGSRTYANPWIVENRFVGKTDLYRMTDSGLEQMEYPVTNIILVGEKE